MALIHKDRLQTSRTKPPIDMMGDVTTPQKIIVMPSASRNGAYEGSTGAGVRGSVDSGSFGRIIAIPPALRLGREPGTNSRTSRGSLRGRPCTPAPTSAGRRSADRYGVSVPTAHGSGA